MRLVSKFWSPLIWLLDKLSPDPYESMNPKDYSLLGTSDQRARIPKNRITYYYVLIRREVMDLLREVYDVEYYIRPTDELNLKYLILVDLLKKLRHLGYIPPNSFCFDRYPDLFQTDSTLDDFGDTQSDFTFFNFELEIKIDQYGGVTTALPDDLETLFRETHELLIVFKNQKNNKKIDKTPVSSSKLSRIFSWDKSGKEYIFDENHSLKFTAEKSKKIKFFKSLVNEDGGWVSKKDIIKNLKVKDEDIRSMVSQLRNDIKTQKVDKFIWIDTNNNGSYKLTSKI